LDKNKNQNNFLEVNVFVEPQSDKKEKCCQQIVSGLETKIRRQMEIISTGNLSSVVMKPSLAEGSGHLIKVFWHIPGRYWTRAIEALPETGS
jgi:hypothetical protein